MKGVNPTLYFPSPTFPLLFSLLRLRFHEPLAAHAYEFAILNSTATAGDSANDAARDPMLAFEFLGLSMEERSLQGYRELCADPEASAGVWLGVRWREEGVVGLDMCRYGRKEGRKKIRDQRGRSICIPFENYPLANHTSDTIPPSARDRPGRDVSLLFALLLVVSSGKKEGIDGAGWKCSAPLHLIAIEPLIPIPIPSTYLSTMNDLEPPSSSILHTLPAFPLFKKL